MSKVIIYVVTRDLGFAPNPFHGCCTLATCISPVRGSARVDDWVIGLHGGDLSGKGVCAYTMKVTEIVEFDTYWNRPEFRIKRPVRNGSAAMMVGDNVYHHGPDGKWIQEDCHHAPEMTAKDTAKEKVLVSRQFYYFGSKEVQVPGDWLKEIGFTYTLGQKHYLEKECLPFFQWLDGFKSELNRVQANPRHFENYNKRYSDSRGFY